MRTIEYSSNQKGGALVMGLILLTVATVATLASMRGGNIQERMTSNQHNKAISLMAAEAGLGVLWNRLDEETSLPAAPSDVDLADSRGNPTILSQNSRAAFWFDPNGWEVINGNTLRAIAVGVALDPSMNANNPLAESRLRIEVSLSGSSGGRSLFQDGVVGCEGVNMVGSGQVDSFSSQFGAYGQTVQDSEGNTIQNSLRTNVNVRTIYDQATFNLSGNAPIYGNVIHPGDQLNMSGGTPVFGNVRVEGNVSANGTVHGTLTAGGNIVFGSASTQHGAVTAGGNVQVDATANPPQIITAGGAITYPNWWVWDQARMDMVTNGYRDNEAINLESLRTGSEVCDEAGVRADGALGEMFSDARNHPQAQSITDYVGPWFNENPNRVTLTGPGGHNSTRILGADGAETILYVDKDLTTSGNLNEILVRGDVTLVVNGDFELSNNTQMNIAENATMRILVTGEAKFSGGSNLLTSNAFLRGDDQAPAVSLFSAYQSANSNDVGVFVGGANNSHIAVYAPYATARIVGSGEIFGAMRAQFVDIRGSGDIHYDETLRDTWTDGSGGSAGSRNVLLWREHIPIN